MKSLKIILKILLLISILVLGVTFFTKKQLPFSGEIVELLAINPIQIKIDEEPFIISKGELSAEIVPRYDYDLYGLVVADYNSEVWHDVTHEDDPFNSKDICAIWGRNLKNNLHQQAKYSHGEFTCYYKTENWDIYRAFNEEQFSNSHLLPASESIYERIMSVKVGDQVHIKGKLVDYRILAPDFKTGFRKSSSIRDDKGNGACEVIYVTDFKVLKVGNPISQILFDVNKYAVPILVIFIILLSFFDIARRPRNI